MQAIEYNDPVTLTFIFLMLVHLDSKCEGIRPLLTVVTVYKIMIVLSGSVMIALLFAYLFSNLHFAFLRPSSALLKINLRPWFFEKY